MVEDAHALQSSMQTEIRSIFAVLSQRVAVAGGSRLPQVSQFLLAAAPLVQRDPLVFARAVRKTCKVYPRLTRLHCHTVLKLTCWGCGTYPSTLERRRA
jgi:hypothetical protein